MMMMMEEENYENSYRIYSLVRPNVRARTEKNMPSVVIVESNSLTMSSRKTVRLVDIPIPKKRHRCA